MLSKKGKPTGFTLPELLVVLLLLALLYLMALPTLQHSWQAVALDGAAQQLSLIHISANAVADGRSAL